VGRQRRLVRRLEEVEVCADGLELLAQRRNLAPARGVAVRRRRTPALERLGLRIGTLERLRERRALRRCEAAAAVGSRQGALCGERLAPPMDSRLLEITREYWRVLERLAPPMDDSS